MNRYLLVILIAVVAIFLSRGHRFYTPSETAVTPARLAKVLDETNGKVLLYFWQPKDPSCAKMDPIVDQVMSEYASKFTLVKVDTSNPENRAVHDTYNITATPTFVVVQKNKIVGAWVGPFTDKNSFLTFMRPSAAY